MIHQYQIADIAINVDAPMELKDTEGFALYRVMEDDENFRKNADYTICLVAEEDLIERADLGTAVFRNELNRVGQREDGYIHTFYQAFTDNILAWNMIEEGSELRLHYLKKAEKFFESSTNIFNASSIERILQRNRKYIFHCSYVEYEGRGILFSAPSGGGKTTQGLLWERYADAKMINGDRCILEKTKGGFISHGLPIAGSSGVFTNKTLPLAGIFQVKKAGQNRVIPLSPSEVFHAIFSELTINGWDPSFKLDAVDFAMELASLIPVYRLECKIDEEAVDVAKTVI